MPLLQAQCQTHPTAPKTKKVCKESSGTGSINLGLNNPTQAACNSISQRKKENNESKRKTGKYHLGSETKQYTTAATFINEKLR